MEIKEKQSNSVDLNVASSTSAQEGQQPIASPKKDSRFSRRNLIRGGIAAAIVGAGGAMALPKVGSASGADDSATKQDIATLEQELSLLTKAASDSELVSHKSYTIDKNSTHTQYPSAKTVFDALTDKVDVYQGTAKANYILVVDSTGKLVAQKFTDEDLSEDSTRPVQNKAIYAVVQELRHALSSLDDYPIKGHTDYGVKSGGVYNTYQTVFETSDLATYKPSANSSETADLTPGMVYKYTGSVITGVNATFAVIKLSNAFVAVNLADASAIYVSNDGQNWALPYGGW